METMPNSAFEQKCARLLLLFFYLLGLSTFFLPPLSFGVKKLFIFDMILIFWPLAGFSFIGIGPLLRSRPRYFWKYFLGALILLTIAFFHGIARSDLRQALIAVDLNASENQSFSSFSWIQDGILYLRYMSWAIAAAMIVLVARGCGSLAQDVVSKWARFWAYCSVIEAIIAGVAYYTSLRQVVGHLYSYDPDYFHWANRFYGTFSSPLEFSMALIPGLLWFFLNPGLFGALYFVIVIAAFFHGVTFSAFLGLGAALCFLNRSFVKRHFLVLTLSAGVFVALGILISLRGEEIVPSLWHRWRLLNIEGKLITLAFRFQPWLIFLNSIFSRWDNALFGLGFARSHTDNSWIHLLRTAGLCFLFLYGRLAVVVARHFWRHLRSSDATNRVCTWIFSSCVAFLVSSLTTDVLIYRSSGILMMLTVSLAMAIEFKPVAMYEKL